MRKLFLAFVVAATAALCLSTTAAAQSPPNVKIETKTAPIIIEPVNGYSLVQITLRIKCDPLPDNTETASIDLLVFQPEHEVAGSANFTCTGRWETVDVLADHTHFGNVLPGPADVIASVFVPNGNEGAFAFDTRRIELV